MSRKDKEIKEIQLRLKKLRKLEAPADLADEILSKTIGPKNFQFNFLATLFNLSSYANLKAASIGMAMILLMAISLTIFYRTEGQKIKKMEGRVAVKKLESDGQSSQKLGTGKVETIKLEAEKEEDKNEELAASTLPLFRSITDITEVNQTASSLLGSALMQVAFETSSVEPLLAESILMNAEAATRLSESLLQALIMVSEVNQININVQKETKNESENEIPSNSNIYNRLHRHGK